MHACTQSIKHVRDRRAPVTGSDAAADGGGAVKPGAEIARL